jgi:hypothetical protein
VRRKKKTEKTQLLPLEQIVHEAVPAISTLRTNLNLIQNCTTVMAKPVPISKGFMDVDHTVAWLSRASGSADLN